MLSIRRSHLLAAIGSAVLVVLAGCTDLPSGPSDPITGTWVAGAPRVTFLLWITEFQVAYYEVPSAGGCALHTIYDLEALGDDEYLLRSTVSPATAEVRITARDGELKWQVAERTAIFMATSTDPSALTVCAGGGDDPAIDCSGLPPVEPGQDLVGFLAVTDPIERGRYYVYAFQPQAQDTVTITLMSPYFDAYLYVYDTDGVLVGENDDVAADSTDAALSLQVVPACYRVEATSFEHEITGSYTLRID